MEALANFVISRVDEQQQQKPRKVFLDKRVNAIFVVHPRNGNPGTSAEKELRRAAAFLDSLLHNSFSFREARTPT